MASYGGFFLKGLAGSLQGMPQRIYDIRWKKKQEEKLQKKQDELMEIASSYRRTADELGADGWYSDDDMMKLNAITITGGTEFQEIIKETHNHIQGMYDSQVEKDFELVDSFIEMSKGMNLKDLDESLEKIRGFVKSEGALNKLAAYESLSEKKHEIQPTVETFPTAGAVTEAYPEAGFKYTEEGYVPTFQKPEAPTMADEKSAVTLLRTFINATPEQFEAQKVRIEERTGLDLSVYTQDILKETGSEIFNLYDTPEEVMNNVKASLGLTVIPKRDTKTGKYYGSFSKKTTTGGGIDINDILFGTNGIMKDYISSGSQLGDEQRIEIRNNYDIIKPSLPKDIQIQVEDYLKQIGIDVTEAIPKPDVIPKKKPFWQADWKYYQSLTDEELYYLADKEDDRKAYEELKKR